MNMYQPNIREKKSNRPREQEVGGVILSFAQSRKLEASGRFREFIKNPIGWLQENEPLRKAVLLEALDLFPRPWVEVSHEHGIQGWKKGVKRVGS
jgi:hypothetical protein